MTQINLEEVKKQAVHDGILEAICLLRETRNVVTADGTEVVDENGNPLAEPREESLDDNETPQAAGAAQQPGDVAPALNTDWIPWAIAAAVIAAIMVAIIIVNVRKKKEEAETL